MTHASPSPDPLAYACPFLTKILAMPLLLMLLIKASVIFAGRDGGMSWSLNF